MVVRSTSSTLGVCSLVKNHSSPSKSLSCVHIGRLRRLPSASTVVIMATLMPWMSSPRCATTSC